MKKGEVVALNREIANDLSLSCEEGRGKGDQSCVHQPKGHQLGQKAKKEWKELPFTPCRTRPALGRIGMSRRQGRHAGPGAASSLTSPCRDSFSHCGHDPKRSSRSIPVYDHPTSYSKTPHAR